MKKLLPVILLLFAINSSFAGEIRVAVASNFADAIKQIAANFEQKTGHSVKISTGSTGKHYAQIKNGAPFDVFFAADSARPELLEKQAVAIAGSRFTYAQGKLVLWSPLENVVDTEGKVLELGEFNYLALANPKLAPYGKAAEQVLRQRGLWDALSKRMVRGENIGQTLQFVKTGNAQLGFVALSQLTGPDRKIEGSYWLLPQADYTPIQQQAVLLRDNAVARDFLSFVQSDEVRSMIRSFGYETP